MPLEIKFNSLNDLHIARYGAGMGVSFIGVSTLVASSNYLSPVQAQEIRTWINGPVWVVETNNWPVDDGYSFDMVEVSSLQLAKKVPTTVRVALRLEIENAYYPDLQELDLQYVLICKNSQLNQSDKSYIIDLAKRLTVLLSCPDCEKIYQELGCAGFALDAHSLDLLIEIFDSIEI